MQRGDLSLKLTDLRASIVPDSRLHPILEPPLPRRQQSMVMLCVKGQSCFVKPMDRVEYLHASQNQVSKAAQGICTHETRLDRNDLTVRPRSALIANPSNSGQTNHLSMRCSPQT